MSKSIQSLAFGVLGGGQLGRMLIQSATDLNIDVHIIDPNPEAPCCHLAKSFVSGDLRDYDTIYHFGRDLDLITIEIENVNTKALKDLRDEEGVTVYPQPEVIELIQDKRVQKQFYKDHDIPTAEFVLTQNRAEVEANLDFLPAVNKLGKEGYDGRGVQILRNEGDVHKAFDKPGLLERLIDFKKEIAVIVSRNAKGEVKAFPAVELVFHPEANLVEYLFSPAEISEKIAAKARQIAESVIIKLDMVGLLAVEMFITQKDDILVNEVAPRPHNSGHQTIEGNYTSQYEQHLRAIFNLPLGDTSILKPSAMVNLLGEDKYSGEAKYQGLEKVLATKGAHVHLYGKKMTKPFRKMGHVTIVDEDIDSLKKKADFVKQTLKVIA
ncbi:5-(carboxyamino)imidazole ribonucleotide synthase [Fulvivirga sp. RKSG066]|uniref:5-(carboxyamino)imidazole ribonucleotide synthase n=1 Tax=Fulvivirga aurantia TaxID=2529383 RepID=UPI0012BC7A42|nr:5-(carboxyamino)imidazole ribonucleotide synthase [Fulvivirga aurantia]MTI23121.1 5-(carboxyamino)imidazole ribonucleotide synthase [Fulvivirga aurantia]